jgi:hypothetical protein
MSSSYFTTEIAHQRTADYISDADNARLVRSLRKAGKRSRAAANAVAGGSKVAQAANRSV